MKTLKQSLILVLIVVIVSVVSYLHGLEKAHISNLSDFKFQLDSTINDAKQIGYDSAINQIRINNLKELRYGTSRRIKDR